MLDRIIKFVNDTRNRSFTEPIIYSREDDDYEINATRTSEQFITDEGIKVESVEFLINCEDIDFTPSPGDFIEDSKGLWELVSLNGEDYRNPNHSNIFYRVFCVKVDKDD
jgi:hypothetical protein